MNQPARMNLQWTCPVPCIRTRRVAHKRLDSDDQPPAKCARLSAEAGEAQGLLGTSPGSPVSPVANPLPATHVGPSRIGPFLILPLADRESVHSAMNTVTGDELLCKVCAIRHCAISLNEWCFETTGLLNSPSDMSSLFRRLYHKWSFARDISIYSFFFF